MLISIFKFYSHWILGFKVCIIPWCHLVHTAHTGGTIIGSAIGVAWMVEYQIVMEDLHTKVPLESILCHLDFTSWLSLMTNGPQKEMGAVLL